jgi:hypothetical protein
MQQLAATLSGSPGLAGPQPAGQAPGGAPPAGGDPSQGGMPQAPPSALQQFIMQKQNQPNIPVTPQDLEAQAQAIAQELITKTETERKSALNALDKADHTMQQLVVSQLAQMRRQMQSAGAQMIMQQQQQAAGGAPAGPAPGGPVPAGPAMKAASHLLTPPTFVTRQPRGQRYIDL